MDIERCSMNDYIQILRRLNEYWGDDEMRAYHHPMFVHEFGDTAYVIRADEGPRAYLFGFISQLTPIGYVHLVAVRRGSRRQGLGRKLYSRFEKDVWNRRCSGLKAITTPDNTVSIAFHKSIGFTLHGNTTYCGSPLYENYSGEDDHRVVLFKALSPGE